MSTFYEHHKASIRFQYSCFDRILLHAALPLLIRPDRAHGFFTHHRNIYPVTKHVLHDISERYHQWVANQAERWSVEILNDPDGRREDIMAPYFKRAKADQIVAIIKAREPANILTSYGRDGHGWHLDLVRRWVVQYNFYINDRDFGPMFIRMCPYFPFPARVCLNQHHWVAEQLRRRGVKFRQSENAFSSCGDPAVLQAVADSFSAGHVIGRASKWLAYLTPFFTAEERKEHNCFHKLYFSQVEYCQNLIFRRRAVLDALQQRLLDANRSIGQPDKLTILFGRRVSRSYRGRLQTTIEDRHLGSPVIRSYFRSSSAKQYVRDHKTLRTEPASNDVRDLGVNKAIENLPALRHRLQQIANNYLDVQQDILETFLDRGEFDRLSQPTVLENGKRVPGLKPAHPRLLALMQAILRFTHLAAGGLFTTTELHAQVAEALGKSTTEYKLGSLRYDLSKLRAKGLVDRIPHSRKYHLTKVGYRLCVAYVKLFEKFYAPVVAGIVQPFAGDKRLPKDRLSPLDNAYLTVTKAIDSLAEHVGVQVAA